MNGDPELDALPRRRRLRWRLSRIAYLALIALVVVVGGIYGYRWWRHLQAHVSTDDAFVTGHIAPVSARVSGHVAKVLVSDNQDVKAGDVLVQLDTRDFDVALAEARAASEAARADLRNATLSVPLTDDTTRSAATQAAAALAAAEQGTEMSRHDLEQRRSELRAKQAAVTAADANVRAASADFDRARLDRDRLAELFKGQLVARQDLDHAESALQSARAVLDAARGKLGQANDETQQAAAAVQSQTAALAQSARRAEEARATLATAESQRQQVGVRQTQVDAARSRLDQALANLAQAELNLVYTTIRAAMSGRVTKKTVEVGQVVQPGQLLLAVVDLKDVWVIGNFKETDLTDVRPGQSAGITVDTYPGVVFRGRVDSIQAGSGAVFSLLPPENASGNYVKVVQRVPVKLVFEAGETDKHVLVPGMSVVPTIAVR
jgi:membrane fusion protein (multidrug efflux system)